MGGGGNTENVCDKLQSKKIQAIWKALVPSRTDGKSYF